MRIPALLFTLGLAIVSCTTPPPVPVGVVPPTVAPTEPTNVPTPPVTDGFQVSAEKKQASLAEIKVLVEKLNAIIAKKAFSDWTAYLDRDYLQTYGDPMRLKAYSASSPYLRQYNIKLRTLEDFFTFVVVPSRADVTVDDITFVDENRVQVWTVVDNERVLLYLLKLYGKEWKISSW